MTDGTTSRKVFIDHLLEQTGKRMDDQQLKDEATTMIAAVREAFVSYSFKYSIACILSLPSTETVRGV
jgi:hypothetical protein